MIFGEVPVKNQALIHNLATFSTLALQTNILTVTLRSLQKTSCTLSYSAYITPNQDTASAELLRRGTGRRYSFLESRQQLGAQRDFSCADTAVEEMRFVVLTLCDIHFME